MLRLGMMAGLMVTGGAVALAALPAAAQAPVAPPNDNYLSSFELNSPGKALDDVDTLIDHRDLTAATTQTDLLNPPHAGGPAETLGCQGVSEGHTIWYDFYPQAKGLVQIQTSGAFDSVIAAMPFSTSTFLPNVAQRTCQVNALSNAQSLYVSVNKGQAWTVQIGGEGTEAGPIEVEFNYVVAPVHLTANVTLEAKPTAGGIQIVGLSVRSATGAKVRVQCTKGCGTHTKAGKSVSFSTLRGASLPAGATLKIFVTKPDTIGAYITYKIKRGNFVKAQTCLAPGTRTPTGCGS